jgi:2,5-furandicarboxylate decarboxylase 1
MPESATIAGQKPDLEKFRLRPFVERLRELGEVELYEAPISLAKLSSVIEASPKALHFKRVGPEGFEMVAAVSGSRKRLAAAFGVDHRVVAAEFARRIANPQPIVEVPSAAAPVHQVVKTGADIDVARLPFHVQHELDGSAYISSGIDYSIDPKTGKTNVGCRRLMLRGRQELRSNLTDMSDLKRCYLACVERGEKLPVSFAIGSHPLDYLAATSKLPVDEFGLVATLRGEPVPMVRGITNGVPAPADAEMILEGYFDELGYREHEGPYGEFYGFYGPVHIDPVFHVTAITMRRDVLHQTVLHSGRYLSRTDSANLGSLQAELAVWRVLRAARIEPVAVNCVPATNGRQHVRVALKHGAPGQARAAIMALFSIVGVKHAYIVDDDIDVFSDEQIEWAMSARFQADRDLIVQNGLPAFYAEPVPSADGTVAKAGFDLTVKWGEPNRIDHRRAWAAQFTGPARYQTVGQALAAGPAHFAQIVEGVGSSDGREVALELEDMAARGLVQRTEDGAWVLKPAK